MTEARKVEELFTVVRTPEGGLDVFFKSNSTITPPVLINKAIRAIPVKYRQYRKRILRQEHIKNMQKQEKTNAE